MIIYTNGFRCARNDISGEMIINFTQDVPIFDDTGAISGANREEAATLVMHSDVAMNLAQLITNIVTARKPMDNYGPKQ